MGWVVAGLRGLGVAGLVLACIVLDQVAGPIGGPAAAYAQTVSDIAVEGNRRVEAETIRSYFRRGQGEALTAATIDAALKALYATGLFQDVRIERSGPRLIVRVIENAVINRVAFEGNHKAKDEQLQAEVQSKARGTFSRATVQSDVQRIIDLYQRSGRYDVRVEPKIIDLPNNRVDLVFEITEGAKTGIERIVFVGNKRFSNYRLRDVIKTGESSWMSFIKSNDNYDPDRIEADRDLLRKFYLRNGYADVRIVSAVSEFDPEKRGFIITFTIEEGDQYRFGVVDIQSKVSTVPPESLRSKLRMAQGDIYNAEAVEKTVENMTIEIARRGYPFAAVRPRGDRNVETHLVSLAFVIEEGTHVYIERINIRGNTRTRDYVIRREFDIVEGDAYNRALFERAERRLRNLNYFKTVRITNEPGSAPDRVIVNVDLEEQSTGELSFAGGYSTTDGILGEIAVAERNLLGRGQAVRASLQLGTIASGFELSFVEPYLFDTRLAFGVDVFGRRSTATTFQSYSSQIVGGNLRFGIPLTENFSTQLRYSIYNQQISLPSALNNCNNINPDFFNTFPTPDKLDNGSPATTFPGTNPNPLPAGSTASDKNCYADGEASLAIRKELGQGPVLVSLVGYTAAYNTLDNNRAPTSGVLVELKQDFAGAGGDIRFVKSTIDGRLYNEVFPDVIGFLRAQAGHAMGWGGQGLRMLDHFQGGPLLVRGFQPAGWGPRDLTQLTNNDALGGSMFWGASYELQTPLFFAPKDFGMRFAVFADVGQVWNYQGPTNFTQTGEQICTKGVASAYPGFDLAAGCADSKIRSAIGVGLLWDSPLGPLRFDFAWALTKAPYDRTQFFRFGGGTQF